MSQVCCVEHCNHSRSKNKCTLKRFPTDTQKCKLWEDIIKRDGWERTSWDRICECHFSDEQFEQNRADGLRKLRWDAVPTLFGSNLRVLAKAPAEDVGDRKDSEERMDDNDELEELEVEIEENSNSDENSDVETYIITGDLSNTIQVIKERESPSTTRCNEKQTSDSPPTGKSKTKCIVIRVPSSVGDCSSSLTDGADEEVDGADEEVDGGERKIEEVVEEEDGTSGQQLEESRLAEDPVEENRLTEDPVEENRLTEDPVEENRLTEDPVEENRLTEDTIEESEFAGNPVEESGVTVNPADERICSDDKLEENIPYRQWNVEGSVEGEPVVESSSVRRDSAENLEESYNIGEGTVRNLEGNIEEVATEATGMRREAKKVDVCRDMDATILTAGDVAETFSSEDKVTRADEPELLTQTDLSQIKSDWKNPKLKARDVKIMACGGSSKMLFKKRHELLQSRASHENDNVSDESKTMGSEEIAEASQPVAQSLQNPDVEEAAGQDIAYQEASIGDERRPASYEQQESSEVETSERLEPSYREFAPQVSGACGKDCTTGTDDAVVSVEEKLEKIFSDGENNEVATARVEPSENVHELNDVELQAVQDENVVTEVADEETWVNRQEKSSVGEAEHDNVPTEEAGSEAGEASSDVDLENQETDIPSTVEVTEGGKGKGTESGFESPKRNPRDESGATLKKSSKKRETSSESKDTEEETTPESKKQEKSQSRSKSRGSKDSVEESRRGSSSRREHSNHKESSRRSDKESSSKKSSPEKSSKQHNSHSSREEKIGGSKRSGKADTEAKKSFDQDRSESGKRQTKAHSSTKESLRQSSKVSETEGKSSTKSKEEPKELRSSKRCLIATATTKRKQLIKEEVFEEDSEEEEGDEEKPVSKKAKIIEETVTPAQAKRRGRPPKGRDERKESVLEKAPSEESKSLRHSKRTPKPSEKYRDSHNGKCSRLSEVSSSEGEPQKRTQRRKFSSEEEDDGSVVRKCGRNARLVKRKSSGGVSPVGKRRPELKNVRDEEDEEEEVEEGIGNAQSICRVCGTEQHILLSIFGPEGSQLRLEDKIHSHLPIRVRQEDKLPLGVCHSCVVTLSACDSLVDKCTQVDRKLRKIFKCPPDETIEESVPARARKDKPRPLPTERAAGPSQVAEQQSKEAGRDPDGKPQEPETGEPTAPVTTPVIPDVPAAVESPAESTDPLPVAAVPVAASAPVAEPVVTETQVEDPPVEESVNVAMEVEPSRDTRSELQMVMVDQLNEAIRHDAILVKKEEYDSEMVSPMKRFGNTYSTGRRTTSRAVEAMDSTLQDRNSVIVIPPAETLRSTNNDVPSHSEEYILSMDEPPDDAPKTVIDSILDDWDEDEQACTSAANSRLLTIKNPPDSEIVVTRLYNDEEEILAEGESGEIIIQIQEFSGESREQPFWPAPEPEPEQEQETIIPDTDEQQNLTWKCGECGLRGKSVGAFLEHKKGHQAQEKKFFCTLCDQSFASVEMLALHKKEKHYEDDEDDEDDDLPLHARKPKQLAPLDIEEGGFYPGGNCKLYKCAQCDKMFGAAWSWKKHMEAHELDSSLADNRVHKCHVCNRVFFDKTTFEDHKLTHMEGETPFQCSICDAKFATWNVFLTHVHTHKSSKTICKKCGRDFGDVKILRDHVKEAHPIVNDKKFACHLCDKVCRKKIALTEHIRKHTGEMPFECEICHKRFSRLANYRAHAAIHENQRRFACDVCGKRFNRQSIQQRHMKTHMRDTIKTSHVCRVCGEAFNKVNELLEHRLNHTRDDVERAYWMDVKLRGDAQDFSCKVCEMRFTTVEAVLLHMPSHTDDERDIALKRKPKAYTCDICHRTLWSKRTFQSHKQWHEQKQFPCTQCDKKYATQTGLNYHMFLHTGERPFQCSFCDKCYKNKNDLRIHVRLHTGEYPYKCKFCPKAFRSPSSLIKHGDAHTEERPFKCSYCDQAFKRENTRANHERIHTNDKRFTCKYCNKGFIQKGACMKHEKWHENEEKKKNADFTFAANRNPDVNPVESMEDNMEENDSRDTLEIPEPSESDDSMDSFQVNQMEERDMKVEDVGGFSIPAEHSQMTLAEPVDEANVTAPSSADNNIHITLL